MKVLLRELVSNSEMTQSYRACREKAERFGKVFILKNNKPDAVLFSIEAYERIAKIVERMEDLEDANIKEIIELIPER